MNLLPFAFLPFLHLLLYSMSVYGNAKLSGILKWSRTLLSFTALSSIYGLALLIYQPVWQERILTVEGLGIELKLDPLNLVLFSMISIIGLVVIRFSQRYLEGEPKHKQFIGYMHAILGCILIFVLADNLFSILIAWVLTSLFLHRILTIHPERTKAHIAARKKFILARVGDATLFSSFLILYLVFGTGNLTHILTGISRDETHAGLLLSLSGFLLVITAILKSAQIPFHGWLIEIMESPTPVSAILHAGLINAGPFLIIRFSGLISMSSSGQICLFLFGMASAIFGALTFVHQPSIKNSLGFSSIAHMGFTLTLCSIGAYSAALLHLTAHSFFKAHAFLSSGSELDRNAWMIRSTSETNLLNLITGWIVASGLSIGLGVVLAPYFDDNFSIKMIFFFLLFAVSVLIIQTFRSSSDRTVQLSSVLISLITIAAFVFFERLFSLIITQDSSRSTDHLRDYLSVGMVLLFTAIIMSRYWLLESGRYSKAIKIHLRNGLYINQYLNHQLGFFKRNSHS